MDADLDAAQPQIHVRRAIVNGQPHRPEVEARQAHDPDQS